MWACQKYPTFCPLCGQTLQSRFCPCLCVVGTESGAVLPGGHTALSEMLCRASCIENQRADSCLLCLGARAPCSCFAGSRTQGRWRWFSGMMPITSAPAAAHSSLLGGQHLVPSPQSCTPASPCSHSLPSSAPSPLASSAPVPGVVKARTGQWVG